MSLPIFYSKDQDLSMMQTKWASILDPVVNLPWSTGVLLKNVTLTSGANIVNHKLSRTLQGWMPVRFHGNFAQIFDTQDTNTMPSLTLLLNASTGVTVDLLVF